MVPLRGGAFLQVVTTRSDVGSHLTYHPANPAELVGSTRMREALVRPQRLAKRLGIPGL